ncbi:DUF4304 domain-containing protein [Hymenobacter endophyticus]|uniref:DUF4304 domain-containing protein n=1 Tax=Hymenobacter endophyticus TaxID=3076335 RepID=A0ABU3TJA7_9BACT|nr:DUF4304 domain-containing protein [Hymenobacter endophyticus]MDU0371435.1 DUF4304 domain-containing protein [Hymenobacter endophyticus]
MAKSSTQIRFDNLVSGKLWPLFKELDYKRRGNNFRQYFADEGWGRILNVQKSAWNDPCSIQFTINVGIYLLEAERVNNWGRVSAERFLEPDCLVRKRIGRLIGEKPDRWYELTPESPVDVIEQEVLADVRAYALPFLQQVQSTDDIIRGLLKEKWPNDADGIRAAFMYGYQVEALQWLEVELAATIYQHRKTDLLKLKTQLLSGVL